eukprot:CAMPEP_0113900524 /NCGR_PEP_ID=MMETSP0780_2-20120614/20726_1 /TAXON_ID=652834 /ORGANISM="Palpitomonas bilix" /LENGTH=519 /DNA_ID=CAMNT_0000892995 /DNA_START=205 /DNA_END=1764 /DNA_ORIENTATION=+ /assembly_acc=CAM_ASM_000599
MALLCHLLVWFPLLPPNLGVFGQGPFPPSDSYRAVYAAKMAEEGRKDGDTPRSGRAKKGGEKVERPMQGVIVMLDELRAEWNDVKAALKSIWVEVGKLEDGGEEVEGVSETIISKPGEINPRLLMRAGGIDVRQRSMSVATREKMKGDTVKDKIAQVVSDMGEVKDRFVQFRLALTKLENEFKIADEFGQKLRRKVAGFEKSVLVKVAKGAQMEVLDVKEQREILRYCQINPQRVGDIWKGMTGEESSEDLETCEHLLKKHSHELKRIFRYYSTFATSATSHSGSISRQEYLQFIKDCKLVSKALPQPKLDIIFIKVGAAGGQESGKSDLQPEAFIEALYRIAHVRYTSGPMSERVEKLLAEHVMENSGKSDVEKFRKEVNSKETRAVFAQHRAKLEKIFKFYAAADKAGGGQANKAESINLKEFSGMVKDANLMGNGVIQSDLPNIFGKVQQDEELGTEDIEDSESELCYPEFQEAVAVLAVYKFNDPYNTLAQRLDTFCTNIFIPNLATKVKGLMKA